MDERPSPYVYRDEPTDEPAHDDEGRDVVIVDGRAMTYRSYHGRERIDL